jgi:hypothetical protein
VLLFGQNCFCSFVKLSFSFLMVGTAATLLAQPAPANVRLRPGTPICLSENAPEPVRRAVRDLQRDLKAVLGADSPLVSHGNGCHVGIVVEESPALAGREAHSVFTRGSQVVLQGADTRGTIYAVYTFSEQFLGVPPLWFWASWKPAHLDAVDVPAGTHIDFAPPYVRWRAWFPNDQDYWRPGKRARRKTTKPSWKPCSASR